MRAELESLVGPDAVLPGTERAYLEDATSSRGFSGRADAVVLPDSAEQVAAVVAYCYGNDVPLTTRGGGTGFAGGAVPIDGGIVLSLERMTRVRRFEPELWLAHVEAGVRTGDLRRLARGHGLFFPPDPGASEQSTIGGNVATNAGGPHAFKYGVTGRWVTGLEAVLPPGEIVTLGGAIRKDAAGYDLKSLLIGSEGTLGVVTAAWLRLIPAPEVFLPVAAFYADVDAGCAAIGRVLGSGLDAAAVEFLDRGALEASGGAFPGGVPSSAGFLVVTEADGSPAEAQRLSVELAEALEEGAVGLVAPRSRREVDALWHWREGVTFAVTAVRGGKVAEDVVVPLDRLAEIVRGSVEIGRRHDLEATSWGHAGDGNVHTNFLVRPDDGDELRRADRAVEDLFDLAISLGGSISGEHGLGWLKRGYLERQWSPRALELHRAVKDAFDPKGLLNPGKKA